ncbi:MAG: hypothetical protein EZS28_026798 [Streblomastix strix]|uniref:Uncharacterized protein n=1 Tax=Streblomastix strix TaxID=222440 RepID=A0A5J4V6G6_9EUKA|nr:MAG: hypothetical protein EZS28_026798 [Streblomastix strix]
MTRRVSPPRIHNDVIDKLSKENDELKQEFNEKDNTIRGLQTVKSKLENDKLRATALSDIRCTESHSTTLTWEEIQNQVYFLLQKMKEDKETFLLGIEGDSGKQNKTIIKRIAIGIEIDKE